MQPQTLCMPPKGLRTHSFSPLLPLLAHGHSTWRPRIGPTDLLLPISTCVDWGPAYPSHSCHDCYLRTSLPDVPFTSKVSLQPLLRATALSTEELIDTTDAKDSQRSHMETALLLPPRIKAKMHYPNNTIDSSIEKKCLSLRNPIHSVGWSKCYTRCIDINVRTQETWEIKEAWNLQRNTIILQQQMPTFKKSMKYLITNSK